MSTQIVEADVLVIGGGGAGARAALEANRHGARVALAMKGEFGNGGATAFKAAETAGLNVADGAVDPNDNPGEHFRDIREAALGMCDELLGCILAREALELTPFLESVGVMFESDREGLLTVAGCFASRSRMHILKGHGEPIVRALKNEIQQSEMQVHEFITVTDLLVQDGVCLGTIALDDKGQWVVFSAKAVILATGGAGQLFVLTLSPPDITGDGYAMGYRCGADLMNLEFMQVGFGTMSPFKNLLHCWVWGLHPRLLNGNGDQFLTDYLPHGVSAAQVMDAKATHYPFSCRDISRYLDLAIQRELESGRTTPSGGVFLDFTEVDEAALPATVPRGGEIRRMWAITKDWYRSRMNIDLDRQLLEIGIFAHAINGGLTVDEFGQTTIERFYAIGETAAGPHGADRLGGNMLVGCQVFGKRAGIHAAEQAAVSEKLDVPTSLITDAIRRVESFGRPQGEFELADLRLMLQRAMSENVLIARNEDRLKACLAEIGRIRDYLNNRAQVRSSVDLPTAVEVDNLLVVAELVVNAALLREESRGSHYREDYPDMNDSRWGNAIVIRSGNGGMEFAEASLPVVEGC